MSGEVEQAVRALAARQVRIERGAFEKWLGARRSAPQLEALALVFACLQHDEQAIRLLEAEHLTRVRRALLKMDVDDGLADELMSWLRFELFAREDGPLLATYGGKGDLTGFLRAIAAHEALKRLKKRKREVTPDDVPDVPVPHVDLAVMKGAYGKEFTAALEEAFRSLDVSERNLLRQYFLDGLSIDALAQVLSVHRATAARRVNAARERLTTRVRTTLVKVLAMSESGVEEVITLSNLDESLSRILRRTRPT